jgi:hypothetical protein
MAPLLEAFTMLDRALDKICGSVFILSVLCNTGVCSSSVCTQQLDSKAIDKYKV